MAKWIARSRTSEGALRDGSWRAHRSPRRLSGDTTAQILALRQTRATAWQISAALGVPRSRVTRAVNQAGLKRVAPLEPPSAIQRHEWPHAGDLLYPDIKRVGRIREIGHCILGDRRARARAASWAHILVAIDDATRLASVEVRRSQRARFCAAFLRRTVVWLRRRGIRIRRLLTDNGSAYRVKLFARVCRPWAIRHRFTRPYRPQTNGKAERFIQTCFGSGRIGIRT